MKNSIRTEIHTLLNNELKALKETLESLERIGIDTLPLHAIEGISACLKSRYDYIEDMYHYLTTHPLYKGNTKAIESKFNTLVDNQVSIEYMLDSWSESNHIQPSIN